MIEIQAPNKFSHASRRVFLAGSIEMGKAEDWQNGYSDAEGENYV